MNTDSLRTSLRCLVHPATMLSIVLLLLNDHLFKIIAPSWITGKASDFAGLFFFPFLLAAGLSVFLAPLRHIRPMIIGRMAFAITAIWFTAAKATPLGHALTTQFVSAMLGHEVSVILDPTDLIGLVILWPAWRLWCREALKAARKLPIRAGWLALALATIATVATTPNPQEDVVRLVVADGEMYALTTPHPWQAYKASDDGRSWSRLDSLPETFKNESFPPEEVVVTDPNNPRMRYRVRREEKVEYSEDGGSTWHTAWQVPAGRRHFMDRYVRGGLLDMLLPGGATIKMGPYDLAFTPDGSGTLVVAMGTEGVLVRDPSGTWSSYTIGLARPTPFSTLGPGEALYTLEFPEGVALLSFVPWISAVLSIVGWVPILRTVKRVQGRHKAVWVVRPALVALIVFLLVMAGGYIFTRATVARATPLRDLLTLFFIFLGPLLPVPLVPVLLITWSRAISLASDRESAKHSRKGCMWTTLGLFPVALLPFVLWVVGIVPWYNVALVSAIALGLAVVGVGGTKVYRHSRAAVGQDERRVPSSNAP